VCFQFWAISLVWTSVSRRRRQVVHIHAILGSGVYGGVGVTCFCRLPRYLWVARRLLISSIAEFGVLSAGFEQGWVLGVWTVDISTTSALGILGIIIYCNYQTMYKIHFTEESRIVGEFQFWMSRFALMRKEQCLDGFYELKFLKKNWYRWSLPIWEYEKLLAIYRYSQPQ
jgi:hypothetical protein